MPNDMNEGREIMHVEAGMVALLNKSEIDQQIATAKKYPRNVKSFRDEVLTLATLNEEVASECSYALQRKGKNGEKKTIEGPSARFAEIIAHAWGNCRSGARVVDDRGNFVTSQGAFMDLEKNAAITYEVQRSIVTSGGSRYSQDMVGVTANAACSIALRNAVLKGVPKALWYDLWEKARKVAIGDETTLANKRANAVKKFAHHGVTEAMILTKLDRASLADVTLEDIGVLLGIFTSLKEGEITPEQAFADEPEQSISSAVDAINSAVRDGKAEGAKTVSEINASVRAKTSKAPKQEAAPADRPPLDLDGAAAETQFSYSDVAELIKKAKSMDELDLAADVIRNVLNEQQRAELDVECRAKRSALTKGAQ